ncbi:MAG: hypothetical protein H7Z14_08100 [Anaerolineae bacterium]|nr:hypothetical protein [Phycisphaerae bacterium]
MLPDLPGVLIAMVLFALVAIAPGWAIAYWTNLLNFRSRFFTFKLAIALAASLAFSPILLVLIARWTNLHVGAALIMLFAVLAVVAMFNDMRWQRRIERAERIQHARRRWLRIVVNIALVWMVIVLAWLLDVRVQNRLYMSVPWVDHSKRVAWIDAIMRTGVPPTNPSTHPGQPIKMFYYYGWYVWSATVQTLGGGLIRPLHALVAGVVWSGWAFIGSLALALRYLGGVRTRRLRQSWLVATLLLCVTGLDIGHGLLRLYNFLTAGGAANPPRTTEWWNEQVTGFFDMMLWVPHHVCGVVVGIFALSLLRWMISSDAPRRHGAIIAAHVTLAVSLASLATVSLYVALPLGIFLACYTMWCLFARRTREAMTLIGAAVLALLLAAQFLYDLLTAPGAGSAVAFTIREFTPITIILRSRTSPTIVSLVNFALLPFNWFMEFGFFLIAGIVYWFWRRAQKRPVDRFAAGLFWTSILVASFLRSTIGGNDLGWRSIMWAQIVLLVWAVEPAIAVWSGLFGTKSPSADAESLLDRFPRTISALLLLLVLGVASTAYDMFLLRFSFALWPDKEVEPPRALAVREAHEWVSNNLPTDAIVQHNLNIALDVFAGHYGNRQVVFAEPIALNAQGIDVKQFQVMATDVYRVFMTNKSPQEVHNLADRFGITAFVAKDTDANWTRKDSWFWTQPAIYENSYVRIIATKDLLAPATQPSTR